MVLLLWWMMMIITASVIRLQSWWRMIRVRKKYRAWLADRLGIKRKYYRSWCIFWKSERMHSVRVLGLCMVD